MGRGRRCIRPERVSRTVFFLLFSWGRFVHYTASPLKRGGVSTCHDGDGSYTLSPDRIGAHDSEAHPRKRGARVFLLTYLGPKKKMEIKDVHSTGEVGPYRVWCRQACDELEGVSVGRDLGVLVGDAGVQSRHTPSLEGGQESSRGLDILTAPGGAARVFQGLRG